MLSRPFKDLLVILKHLFDKYALLYLFINKLHLFTKMKKINLNS